MRRLFLYLIISTLLLAGLAKAATFSVDLPLANDITQTGPAGIIANLYDLALMFSGVLAFGAIVYGGILWTIAGGNSSKVGQARDIMTNALLGILLLLGSYLILHTINPALTTLSFPEIQKIPSTK